MKYKIPFFAILVLLLSLAPITVLSVTPWELIKDDPGGIVRLGQRLIGLWAYTLLFVQIVLGAFMAKWTEKFGGWVFNYHIFEGILIYVLIVLHPLLFTVFNYYVGQGFDPFYTYIDVCLLCDGLMEMYYNFGRISFWLLTIGVAAGLFRAANPFMRIHWKKFHVLNYFAFLLVFIHSLLLGTDVGTPPFSLIHTPFSVVVLGIVIWKIRKYLQTLLSKQNNPLT